VSERTSSGRSNAVDEFGGLRRIRQRLDEAAAGTGGVVFVEGGDGSGKTRLMTAAAEAARAGGMRVLEARGHALEREFPFGVVIQLFQETWHATSERERSALLEGPARLAGEVLAGVPWAGQGPASAGTYSVIHAFFWLVRALASDGDPATTRRPLALVVDDVDCADGSSLRFLGYLASRISPLPTAVVVAAHPDLPSIDPPALSALRSASELLSAPAALSIAAVSRPLSPTKGTMDGPRAVTARVALRKSLAAGHRESVVDLAELAWGDGAMVESDDDADAWPAVAGSLLFVDELELALKVVQTARASGGAGAGPLTARWEGWSLYHQGRITAALGVAEAVRATHRGDPVAHGLIAACRIAQGRLEEADAALPLVPPAEADGIEEFDAPVLLDLRAQLRLEQLRPAEALADALEAGRLARQASSLLGSGVVAWRSTAALARLALGENRRARALAEEELELARERGLARVVVRDMRVLAFAVTGTRRLDLLGEAVRIGRAAPPRLEYVNALVDLGAATRRANQRTAARHPLREGLELAERHGASALARRAREELYAAGARSRRVLLSGVAALTPSERRVGELAAGGLTTRQIAQVLFVTPKTVEFHLRHVYRKLDIPSSRADLARALSPAASG
jgi:DNA-binding CsgD family transcriptional regulator